MRCFFNWAVEHCYAKQNPFDKIRLLPKMPKRRTLVPAEMRGRIVRWFQANKPAMEIVCHLVYTSAVRPLEASKIQIGHIDLGRHCIMIPGENAKNKKCRCASLSPRLEALLRPIVERGLCADWFLFGTGKQMEPGAKPARKNYFCKCWDKMRAALCLPNEIQLYSLRDTGLTDLLHAGVDQLTVQHHADHSSIAIQNIYTDHYDPDLCNKIYNNAPEF